MSTIKLGDKIRCKVTGLKGVATARVEYLNGCIQYALTPKAKNGIYPDATYLDEKQLEVLLEPPIQVDKKATGGPQINSPKV